MRKIFTVSFLAVIFSTGYAQTGGSWVKKADISTTNRESAVGFAVNNKGYLGLGNAGGAPNGTMWEFDFSTNVWTQKANMTGGGRVNPVAFVLGANAYVGTGENISFTKDKKFYQYNPSSNVWTAKTDFGGTARTEAVAFAIGSKGYVGTGDDGTRRKDFWEYDPIGNTWTQKADFGGTARSRAVGFSIGSKGYIGTGNDGTLKKDFWEYDPTTNVWVQKGDFAGAARESAVGFSVSNKGYIATGDTGIGKADIWEYNPTGDEWIQRTNFTGQRRYVAAGFGSAYNDKAYLGTGFTDEPSVGVSTKDFYEFTPALPPTAPVNAMVTAFTETSVRLHWLDYSYDETGFSIERSTNGTTFSVQANVAADVTTYTDNGLTAGQIYYYRIRATKTTDGPSAATNIVSQIPGKNENGVWTLVNDNYSSNPSFGSGTSTFTINGIIYLTNAGDNVGNVSPTSKDCWAYDPASNSFTQKAKFGGEARIRAATFVLNGKGYVGTGYKGPAGTDCLKDLWQYDPATNQWTQKADVGTLGRSNSMVFTIGNKAYVGAGYLSTGTPGKDFYEYDPTLDTWTPKADFPFTTNSSYATGYNNKGYAVYLGTTPIQFYEYDATANTWTAKGLFPIRSYGFRGLKVIQNRLYGSTYTYNGPSQSTLWEYEPAKTRWIERAPHSTESQYSEVNTAVTEDKLLYFTQATLYTYNPSYGIKSPAALTAEVIDPVKIKLSWSVDAAASKTQVYRAESEAGPYELVVELTSDKTTYVDEFDGVNKSAYYKIRAINTSSASDYTNPVLAKKRGAWKQLNKIASSGNTIFGDVSVATSTRGYLGISTSGKTWWEYNPGTDSWTQKADFPGEARTSAISFSLNDQVYVGLGYDYSSNKNVLYKDFWQYDPTANTWTKKKDFAGTARIYTATTTADGHGFVVGGDDDTGAATFLNEVWAYSPTDDSWVELPKIPTGIAYASTFVKDNNLWVMNGGIKNGPSSWGSTRQAYKLDMTTLTWTKEANPFYYFSGDVYQINNIAYISVTGMIGYDFTSKKWMLKPALPASGYYSYRTFSLLGKIYAVTNNYEVWSYSPETLIAPPENLTSQFLGDRIALSWQNMSSQPAKTKIQYLNTSNYNSNYTDLAVVEEGATQYVFNKPTPDLNYRFRAVAVNSNLEQSVSSNATFENSGPYWTEISDVPALRRTEAATFSSNGKIYYGTGTDGNTGTYYKDLWELDPATGIWTQKASLPGEERSLATTFVLGNDAYLGFGKNKSSNALKDLWKYNAVTNTWVASVDYANGIKISGSGVFVADGKAYLLGGELNTYTSTNELWRFDGMTWVQLTSLPGNTRKNPITFTVNGKAYVGSGNKMVGGTTNYGARDFWEYTISSDSWKQLKDLPPELTVDSRSFAVTGTNSAIVFTSGNGGSNGYGIQNRVYWPEQDKWTSLGNALHSDYMYNAFTMTQEPVTGFTYAIVSHNEFGVKLWRYEYLLNGPNLVEAILAAPSTARLKWRKIAPQPDSVVIYRSEIANAIGTRVGAVKTADTTAVNTVSNGKTYYYRIRSYSNSGQFKTSSERKLVVDYPPAAPISLIGELIGDNIALKWQPGAGAPATSYVIERAVNSDTDFRMLGTSNSLSFNTADFPAAKLSYRVKATNASGESPYSNVVLILVTGIEEESAISVYPNPATDYFTVQIERNDAPLTVELLDSNGRKLYKDELHSTTRVDMTQYHAGIYFVHLSGNKLALNKYIKIIKK